MLHVGTGFCHVDGKKGEVLGRTVPVWVSLSDDNSQSIGVLPFQFRIVYMVV